MSLTCKSFLCGKQVVRPSLTKSKGFRKVCVMRNDLAQVATSYAGAILELSQQKGVLDVVHSDMDTLSSVLKNDEALKDFLINPVISDDKKYGVLDKIASEGQFSQYTINFLKLLISKGRMEAIQDIFVAFEAEYCKLTDTSVAVVKSAVQLENEQQFVIAKKLQELTGSKNIKLKPVVDASLIGGFLVQYGSCQVDLSVKGQLDKITGELNELASSGALA
eukprot:TRINITY_DN26859_c1_g1_i4.p2 TRINITY_DN26859_c1_g1~~TRINITY_DN26859_c1_g1_i4.p2  ORF type:complete len:221 (+),score=39.87 TRINITY_DN26859_c1_g1_i4:109-771(+)